MTVSPLPIEWHPGLPIFASERYLRLLGDEFGWLGGFSSGDPEPVCILPFAIIKAGPFRLARFTVETIALGTGLTDEQERPFLSSAVGYFRSLNVDLIVPATFNSLFRVHPAGANAAPYCNLVVDLTRTEDTLWKAVHSKHRNVIRNAMKQGVVVKQGVRHLRQAYELTRASFLRSARSPWERARVRARLSYTHFEELAKALGANVQVFVAEQEGVAQCAAVIPWSEHSAYYMHGGAADRPVTGASNLLQWEMMKAFRGLGVARYNFFGVRASPPKGSKAEGLRMFKERFGGTLTTGYMWKFPLSRTKYALYQLAARIRSGGDVVDQERRRLTGDADLSEGARALP